MATIVGASPATKVVIRETRVQGKGAANAIVSALAQLAGHPDVDVVVLARGGGSFRGSPAQRRRSTAPSALPAFPIRSGPRAGHATVRSRSRRAGGNARRSPGALRRWRARGAGRTPAVGARGARAAGAPAQFDRESVCAARRGSLWNADAPRCAPRSTPAGTLTLNRGYAIVAGELRSRNACQRPPPHPARRGVLDAHVDGDP